MDVVKKVFILGGTGFLGYFTTKEMLKRGYTVSTVSLPPMPTEDLLPKEVECTLGDINKMTDEEILKMLEGVYGFVYAAGADERVVPDAPAMKFFYEANVRPTQRLARLARQAGVKKFVLYGSYFAHFAEKFTDIPLMDMPYPRTRLLQEEVACMEGEGAMDVTTIRLPYIFGIMPGRMPLWTMFVDRVINQEVVSVLGGGTAAVTSQQVAEATIGAMENGKHRGKYAISGFNMKHSEFHEMIAEVLGQTETKVVVANLDQVMPSMEKLDAETAAAGKEHGIHLSVAAMAQDRDCYLDPADTMPILKYNEYDLRASIMETLRKCVE